LRNLFLRINAFLQNFTIVGFHTINENYIHHSKVSTDSYSNTNITYDYILSDLPKILSGLKPSTYHHIHFRYLKQAFHQTYFKTLSPTSKNLQILPALSNLNMTFFALFSLPYAQNIIFFPVVINSTYLHHKRVPVVLLVDYCLLLTEENSALHSYFYLLRMVYTVMRWLSA